MCLVQFFSCLVAWTRLNEINGVMTPLASVIYGTVHHIGPTCHSLMYILKKNILSYRASNALSNPISHHPLQSHFAPPSPPLPCTTCSLHKLSYRHRSSSSRAVGRTMTTKSSHATGGAWPQGTSCVMGGVRLSSTYTGLASWPALSNHCTVFGLSPWTRWTKTSSKEDMPVRSICGDEDVPYLRGISLGLAPS